MVKQTKEQEETLKKHKDTLQELITDESVLQYHIVKAFRKGYSSGYVDAQKDLNGQNNSS